MKDILIESFNISYANNVNLYLTKEIINKINILISDKLDIFIEYSAMKLKNDYEYFSFLLDSVEELGNSSKTSIINLFSNVPKKLNESIYYLIENDIFYYVDIFFRENKKIFIDNFIKFYLSDVNKFDLNIYNIENYIEEMIADRNFNKSLNNISSYLISEVKNEIFENIKNSIFVNLNSFIDICNKISNDIQIKLNLIKTSELPEEMTNLVQLIDNYNNLVSNQSNRYNFIMGETPFNLLNIFIHQELEPPLLLILEKYNSIEEDLINQIKNIAENFPDCYSEVKNNLLGNKIDLIDFDTDAITSTLFNYENDLVEDIESYLNKLIHYIYIDGLLTMEKPCEDSDCQIKTNSLRRLEKFSVLNNTKNKKYIQPTINRTKIAQKVNKKIIANQKRKTDSVPEYTSDMGALSESDVLYYLSDLKNTTYKLNKTYFGKEYTDVNITTNKFLTKIN